MNLIFKSWVKYYTKETFKTLKLITIGSAIIITMAVVKYKPAFQVTLAGETIGYVTNKEYIETKIDNFINSKNGNVAFREVESLPEYTFIFVNRDKQTDEKAIMLAVENLTTTTYKTYAITSDGETKSIVSTQEEADSIINEVKQDLNAEVDLKLGIVEVYSTELTYSEYDEAKNNLIEYKTEKVNEYETKKAEEERKAAEEAAKKAAAKYTIATTYSAEAASALNSMSISMPVNGQISSRFGERSSSRSTVHTGLDLCCSSGTAIRPVSAGTVVFASYKGSYGNLVIIDHGNGVQSWYAHCSAIYVSVGQSVDTSSTIAAVGSTGNSTGPHLHLELRVNGEPVNPYSYLYR